MGQRGWHNRGYLPHFDGYDVTQHVVFRLHDSVPPGETEGDDVLDRGLGSALLAYPRNAEIVARALRFHDHERYELAAWCVMPNHVHVLLTTKQKFELGAIVRTWKQFSANSINKAVGRSGAVWAADYFDRYVRDQAQFDTAKRYIEMNPVVAGLCDKAEDWRFSSVGWSD
ncbi:MAG: transposase [Hyphomonadaceae bacterium]|nr:transposase [Hyphomonadaceae bacterium]